jgi:TRAP-type C4-dicarboxylate transport system substrate-binding protein
MMKKLKLISGLVAGLIYVHSSLLSAAEITWDMPNEYPATSVQGEGDVYFGKRLKERSQGKIEIAHHFGGALGFKSKDQLDAVADGAVVLANTFIPTLGGVDPIFLLSSLPFLSANTEEAKLLFDVAKPYYNKVLAKHNQKLLYASPWPSSGIWGKEPLNSGSAIAKLKMRTYDANGTKVFRNSGASPIQLSWADIVPQLSTGGIDGVLTSVEAGLSASFNDYTNHFTAINYDSTINLITMNLDTWNSLSPVLQKAVSDAASDAEKYVWANTPKVISDAYSTAGERGVTVVTDIPERYRVKLQDAANPVVDAWVKKAGPIGKQLLDEYKKQLAQRNS